MSSRITSRRHVLVITCAAAASFGLVACSSSGGGAFAKGSASASVTPSGSRSASASPTAAPSGEATAKIGGSGTTGGGGGGAITGTAGPTLSINVTAQPTCSSGTNLHEVMGVSPVIAWTSTGTTNVTLSIDNPGIYGTFPPTGSTELPFGGCTGPDGSTVSHTYTFTTVPGGVTRTVTLTAIAHVITDVGTGSTPDPSATASP
jgi:hypothetical protein